jgi:hypothetical protein
VDVDVRSCREADVCSLAVIVSVSAVLRRIVVRREVARDWPIFADDSEAPAAVGVTSVEVRRRVDESVASAAVVSATALGAAPELPGRDAAARPAKNLAGGSGEADSPVQPHRGLPC